MGYSPTQKGYLLYSLSQRKLVISRDVLFKETIFPFKQVLNKHKPLFSAEPIATSDDFPICDEDRELPVPVPICADDAPLEDDPMIMNDDAPELEVNPNEGPDIALDEGPVTTELMPIRNEEVPVRKSTRTPHPPIWMRDYVTQTSTSHCHSQSNYVSYDNVSSKYKAYLSMFSTDTKPRTFEEAIKDKRWILCSRKCRPRKKMAPGK